MTFPECTGPGPVRVGVLGDSIATMAAEEFAAKFEVAPYQRAQASFPGMKTADVIAAGWHTQLAATLPEHVVVVLGSNDCGVWANEWNGFAVLANQQTILSAFPAGTLVHWVKPYLNPPDPKPGLQDRVAGFINGLSYWQASGFPNLRLVEWPAAVFYVSMQGGVVLCPDGVHPTESGQTLLAHLCATSVAA